MKNAFLLLFTFLLGSLHGAEIESSSLKATFGEKHGELLGLVANGRDYVSPLKSQPIFTYRCCRAGVFTNAVAVESSCAKEFRAERDGAVLRLTYENLGDVLEKVTCTVTACGEDLVWRITAKPRPGWACKSVEYPSFQLAECLGSAPEDDVVMVGQDDGGLVRNPMDPRRDGGRWYWTPMRRGRSPGELVASFGFFYDDAGGLYTAAYDAEGYPKELLLDRWVGERRQGAEGYAHGNFQLKWTRWGYTEGEDMQDYDVVMRAVVGKDCPTTWYDAADVYKEWAHRQSWSRTKFLDRSDLPQWAKEAPFVMGFETRDWLGDPAKVDRWLQYKERNFPGVPFLVLMVGWEQHGDWIGNQYFPCYPSDDAFRSLCAKIKKAGGHPWPWPSGHHWTITVGKRTDGTHRLDFTEDFLKRAAPHAVVGENGQVHRRKLVWLEGGESSVMCPADPWTVDWWNKDVARALVERGADIVQADQDNNGRIPEGADCWSLQHGHPPGPGLWEAKAMRHQFETMIAEMRKVNPDALMSFEDTHECYNDLMSFVDYRDCRGAGSEWASVFNYLYHEYVCPMQAGSEFYERPFWLAHAAADGQVPRLPTQAHWYDLDDGAFPNGDFETVEPTGGFANWEKPLTHRVSDDAVNGKHALLVDGGQASTTCFQIARSLKAGDFFAPGKAYRITVSLKGVRDAPGNQLNVAVIRQEEGKYRSLGGTSVKVPNSAEGWKTVSREFKMPSGGETVRFMFDVYGNSAFLADDLKVEELAADGVWHPIARRRDPNGPLAFCENWVRLYHGAGRKYLAHGKALHPPEFQCARVAYYENFRGREVRNVKPAVFHSLWEAWDGTRALMFANATGEEQVVAYRWNRKWERLTMKPHELRLLGL